VLTLPLKSRLLIAIFVVGLIDVVTTSDIEERDSNICRLKIIEITD
jgi:hypothetical protein